MHCPVLGRFKDTLGVILKNAEQKSITSWENHSQGGSLQGNGQEKSVFVTEKITIT